MRLFLTLVPVCVIVSLGHFSFSHSEICSGSRVGWMTWTPPEGEGQPVVAVPEVRRTLECLYCFEASPNFTETSCGLYVAVFNLDGALWDFRIFRTGATPSFDEHQRFKDFLDSVPDDMVLAIALQGDLGTGEGNLLFTAVETAGGLISSLLRNVKGREAYCFITITGKNATTQERHASNPYKMAYVETGYLYVETGGLHFRVNSKVHRTSRQPKGVDFVVVTNKVAHPILQLNANVSTLKPGSEIMITVTDADWTNAEEKTIAICPSCKANEIRLTEPLKFMRYRMVTTDDKRAEMNTLNENIYVRGYMRTNYEGVEMMSDRFGVCTPEVQRGNEEDITNSQSDAHLWSFEDQIRKNINAPDYLYVGDCGPRGRGLFTRVDLQEDSYIVFYHGRRFLEHPKIDDESYLFEYFIPNETFWIDAREADGSFGRLMNDNHINPNVYPDVVYVDVEPHIGLFALRDIVAGEELTFNYGGVHKTYDWRISKHERYSAIRISDVSLLGNEEDETHSESARHRLNAKDQIRKSIFVPDYLFIGGCGVKGRGVFTQKYLQEDSYVLYYHGKRLTKRPNRGGAYLCEILTSSNTVWIDGTEEDGSYGRLLNDDHNYPNLVPEVVYVDGEPHIAFFAVRDIEAGEELVYDYGGDEESYWWRTTEDEE